MVRGCRNHVPEGRDVCWPHVELGSYAKSIHAMLESFRAEAERIAEGGEVDLAHPYVAEWVAALADEHGYATARRLAGHLLDARRGDRLEVATQIGAALHAVGLVRLGRTERGEPAYAERGDA